MLEVDKFACTGCGSCVEVCPFAALEVQESIAVVDTDVCAECGACVGECPFDALSLV